MILIGKRPYVTEAVLRFYPKPVFPNPTMAPAAGTGTLPTSCMLINQYLM